MSGKYDELGLSQEIKLLIDRDVREIIESFGTDDITPYRVLIRYVDKVTINCVYIENFYPDSWSLALSAVVNTESYIERFGSETTVSNKLVIDSVTRQMTGDMCFCVNKHYLDRINKTNTPKYLSK